MNSVYIWKATERLNRRLSYGQILMVDLIKMYCAMHENAPDIIEVMEISVVSTRQIVSCRETCRQVEKSVNDPWRNLE